MVKIKSNTKPWLVVLLGLVGLVVLVTFAINPLLKKLIATRVENELVGNFHYNYDKLSVDILARSVTLENVTWSFPKDTAIFHHRGGIGRFKISGISLLSLIRGNHFRIQEIRFDSLNLVTRMEKQLKEDLPIMNKVNEASFNFYDLIKGQMKSLEVEKIVIADGVALWLNPETKIVWRRIEDVQFEIEHIQLDSTNAANNNGWFTLNNAKLEGKNGELFLADSLHKIHLKKFQIDYSEQTINIDSLKVIPLFTKLEMTHAKRYETDRMEIAVPKISVKGIDFEALMVSNQLHIGQILIDQLTMDVFRDKNRPIPNGLHIDMPQLALKNAAQNMKIDTVLITNSFVHYEERSEITQKKGAVFFNDVNAAFYNLTNDSVSYSQNAQAKVSLSAMLMGKAKLEATITFDQLSEKGEHSFKGSLSSFDLTEMNDVFVPLRAFSVRSGHLDKLVFDIRLNEDVANGEITFLYADLKIDKLDKDDLKQKELESLIKSFIANTFLVHTSNPTRGDDPRIGHVHYYRPKDKSLYSYWLKSILDGMKSTISIGEE